VIPYSQQDIDETDLDAVQAVMRSAFLTQGPAGAQFESAFAALHDVPHAIAVCNATAALHLACLALGVGPGSRVWTSPISFVASANCALYCGAIVDFVDIDPTTRNLCVASLKEKLQQAARTGTLPHVLIPVHFAGLPCDLSEMRELADAYRFRILEDASHATGASYRGRPVGSQYADASVFSFHAVKIVTTGEGGLVSTRDSEIARRVRLLRSHGVTRDPGEMERAPDGPWYYEQMSLGFNYRLTDIQAALGTAQLRRLDVQHERRRLLADRYDALLGEMPLILAPRRPDRESAWHLYVVEIDEARTNRNRGAVFASLRSAGVGANVHYIPIHTQPYYRQLGFRPGDFPAAERYYRRALTLPLFPAMTHLQQEHVASVLRAALS